MDNEMKDLIATIIGLIIGVILTPFISFVLGWFIGWIIQITFSNMFINGLALLNITITKNQIPLLCGIISIIGNFFKSGTSAVRN